MATILVVDDNAVSQRMLGYTLHKNGHTVIIASNGVQALERLAENAAVDLVMTDIAMPEMDGIELIERIRAQAQYHALPIIVLTASGMDDDRILARQVGVTDFLTKPASSRELIETVARYLA
jgi:CheY-like chemotaxis protein